MERKPGIVRAGPLVFVVRAAAASSGIGPRTDVVGRPVATATADLVILLARALTRRTVIAIEGTA